MNARVMLKRKPAPQPAPLTRSTQSENPVRASFIERARESSGQPLDAPSRERMETQLGHHFARIPIFPAPTSSSLQIVGASDRTEHAADEAAKTFDVPANVFAKSLDALNSPRLDFSSVRIHTDAPAQKSARALNALAFTLGRDIFFDAGQYSPTTRAGEQLLAHELAHVLQQSSTRNAPVAVQRKQAGKALPPADAVQVALNGDDDATRDLTNNPAWEDIALDEKQSAALIIHLLDGFTGDDDEQAGLVILRKNLAQLRMDDTLLELDRRNRFDQLLDDYDGSEYRELLDLLSNNIERTQVKARYLDAFIAMWWVREHEERAIVVLLERTDLEQQTELLTRRNRYGELRDAIDTEELSVRFEKILKGVNIKHGEQLSTQLQAIFTIEASKSVVAGKRTQAEVDRLLKAAADELAGELLQYATQLEKVLKNPRVSSFAIAYVNKQFERRLNELLEQKSAEFGVELKYNVEFNRGLKEGFGRLWTKQDLAEMDKILGALPPDILHFNTHFREFQRERENPKYSGEAYWSEETIALAGALSRRTTAHELGHMVDYSDKELGKDFRALSKWETLTAADMVRLIPDAKRRDKIIRELENDREQDDRYDREKEGDYYYHYDRYDNAQYVRYHKDACFISGYAQTDPYDDFADTFEEYVVDPKNLLKGCPDKYRFMHVRVFVEYWLKQQSKRSQEQFDQIVSDALAKQAHGLELFTHIRDQFITPLREGMLRDQTALQTTKRAQAEQGKLPDPVPLQGSTAAQDLAAPYLERLRRLLALAEKVTVPFAHFNDGIFAIVLGIDPALESGFDALTSKAGDQFKSELSALFDPLGERIVKGEVIAKPSWPEVDKLDTEMQNVVKLAESYSKYFDELSDAKTQFMQFATRELGSFTAKSKAWEDLRLFIVERLKQYLSDLDAVVVNVRAGVPFDPKVNQDPKQRLLQNQAQVQSFEKTLPK